MAARHPLRVLREEIGWSQLKLAIEADLNTSVVGRIETGGTCSRAHAKALLEALGLDSVSIEDELRRALFNEPMQ